MHQIYIQHDKLKFNLYIARMLWIVLIVRQYQSMQSVFEVVQAITTIKKFVAFEFNKKIWDFDILLKCFWHDAVKCLNKIYDRTHISAHVKNWFSGEQMMTVSFLARKRLLAVIVVCLWRSIFRSLVNCYWYNVRYKCIQ